MAVKEGRSARAHKWQLFKLEDPIYLGKYPRDTTLIVENSLPKEYRERSFIARIGQGELIYPIQLEEKPNVVERVVEKIVKVPTEVEKPKETPSKVVISQWNCPRCKGINHISMPNCKNCGLPKPKEDLENKQDTSGPKRVELHPFGFRSFLKRVAG